MNYLNNIIDGSIIRSIKISDGGIYFTSYQNYVYYQSNKFPKTYRIDNTIGNIFYSGNSGYIKDIQYDIALDIIKNYLPTTPEYIDDKMNVDSLIISDDERNWHILKGTDGLDTIKRITVPSKLYDKALINRENVNSPYYLLWNILFYAQNLGVKTQDITYDALVQYVEELLISHETILKQFENEGLVIEPKIIETIL